MSIPLRQSTTVTLVIGRFVDATDGVTPETALTISQADVRLSKNAGTFAQKNDATSCSHMEAGLYSCPLNTTDTNTLGRLTLCVNESGAAPIEMHFMVMDAAAWDALYAGSGNGIYANVQAMASAVSNAIADALLGRNIAGGSSSGRTVTQALRRLRNRIRNNAGTLEVYQENDTSLDWQAVITTAAGNPISEIDPT